MIATRMTLIGAACAIGAAAMFSWGQAVGHNDARMFQAYDQERTKLAARNCGKRAALWRHAVSGEYACLYVNPTGEAIVRPSADAQLLSAQR